MDEFEALEQTPKGIAFLAKVAFGECEREGGKEIHFPKADPIDALETIDDCYIIIDQELPHFDELGTQKAYFSNTAAELEDALYHSLPGGLYDALLVEMMRRKVSLFAVRL